MCVCLNSSGDFKDSIHHATLALKVDPNAVKALYLRGVAYLKSKSFDEAAQDLKAAIKLNPADKKLRDEFELLK